MTLKLLYVCARPGYPFLIGGSARVAHDLQLRLSRDHGVQCRMLCSFPPPEVSEVPIESLLPPAEAAASVGIRAQRIERDRWEMDLGYPLVVARDFADELARTLDAWAPDVVVTQEVRELEVLRIAAAHGVPGVWYVHNVLDADPEPLQAAVALGARILVVSEFCRERFAAHGIETTIVRPLVELDHYRVPLDRSGRLTLLHSAPMKGVWTFLQVAALLPDLPFQLVEGWPSGSEWDRVQEAAALVPNVALWRSMSDVRPILATTRLLLVPSLCEEASPRVVREAQVSGIPAIVSARGGLPEVLGDGGVVVERYDDPDAWADAILEVVNDPARYDELSRRALAGATRPEFAPATIARRFFEVLAAAVR